MGELLGWLNNLTALLTITVWLFWGYVLIPSASSLRQLQRYETLTSGVEVPILLLFLVFLWSICPSIWKGVSGKEWPPYWRPALAGFSGLLLSVAAYTYFARVLENESPVVTELFYEEAALSPFTYTSVSASAHDPDGDRILYLWESEQMAFERASSNEVRFHAPAVPGDYQITIIAFDCKGAYDKKVIPIHVVSD